MAPRDTAYELTIDQLARIRLMSDDDFKKYVNLLECTQTGPPVGETPEPKQGIWNDLDHICDQGNESESIEEDTEPEAELDFWRLDEITDELISNGFPYKGKAFCYFEEIEIGQALEFKIEGYLPTLIERIDVGESRYTQLVQLLANQEPKDDSESEDSEYEHLATSAPVFPLGTPSGIGTTPTYSSQVREPPDWFLAYSHRQKCDFIRRIAATDPLSRGPFFFLPCKEKDTVKFLYHNLTLLELPTCQVPGFLRKKPRRIKLRKACKSYGCSHTGGHHCGKSERRISKFGS